MLITLLFSIYSEHGEGVWNIFHGERIFSFPLHEDENVKGEACKIFLDRASLSAPSPRRGNQPENSTAWQRTCFGRRAAFLRHRHFSLPEHSVSASICRRYPWILAAGSTPEAVACAVVHACILRGARRVAMPQVNCGCSGVAAGFRSARLRRAFHERNALTFIKNSLVV